MNGAKLLDLPAERVIVADFTHSLNTLLLRLESGLSGRFPRFANKLDKLVVSFKTAT